MKDEKNTKSAIRELFQAVLSLKTSDECQRFFEDLCTPAELSALRDRWRVARLVNRDIPYREIHEKTGVSTATITRVARSLQYGTGGYRLILERLR
jgi:TrpR-related protein YerC/YecD